MRGIFLTLDLLLVCRVEFSFSQLISLSSFIASGNRIPLEARFSAQVKNGSAAHPASYAMDTEWSSSGVKRSGRSVDHTFPSKAGVKGRTELHLLSLHAFMACYKVNIFYFIFLSLIYPTTLS